jgi:lipopolysaccharide transport system permease protein
VTTNPTGESESQILTIIRPRHGWASIGFGELVAARELVYFLVLRDLKVRYAQTAFGVAWAVVQPLAMMLVFTLFLGRVSGIRPDGIPYPLFALAGLAPWMLFSQSLTTAADSLVENSNLLTKVYFPRILLPLAGTLSHIVDFGIAALILGAVAIISGFSPSIGWLALPLLSALALLAALGAGLFLAAVNVRYRDVRYAVPFLSQLWLFATPIAYSSAALPDGVRELFWLNPMTGVVEGFRTAITGVGTVGTGPILTSIAVTVGLLLLGSSYFRRVERSFADVV